MLVKVVAKRQSSLLVKARKTVDCGLSGQLVSLDIPFAAIS